MKTMKKLLGMLLVISLVLNLGAASAFASHHAGDDPVPSDPPATVDPESAAENKYEGDVEDLADIEGGTMTFDKYLVLNKGADVPDVKFKFTIVPGAGGTEAYESVFILPKAQVDYASNYNVIGKPVFVAGTDMVTGTTDYENDSLILTYQKNDSTTLESEAPTTKTIHFMTDDTTADEKYAQKTMTIDFSGVTFVEPGVYRYTITEVKAYTEENTPLPGMIFDPDVAESCKRYLDVYVIDNEGTLEIAGYVLHENAAAPAIGDDKGTKESAYTNPGVVDPTSTTELQDKSTGFSNQYDSKSLAFKKEVAGNQASRDKYFKYTVTISAPASVDIANFWYEIDMDNSAWTWEPTQNVATSYSADDMTKANNPNSAESNMKIENGRVYVKGSALTSGKDFYLQHGQYIQIRNLPAACEYEVAEEAEDYLSTESGVENYMNATNGVLKEEDELMETDGTTDDTDPDDIVFTSYLNTRDGVIPTGLLTVVGPAVALIALAGAGFGIVLAGKRRHEDEE